MAASLSREGTRPAGRWEVFFAELLCAVRVIAFAVLTLGLFRLLLLLFFRSAIAPATGAADFLKAFWAGFKFDSQAAFYLALPGLLGALWGLRRASPVPSRRARAVAVGVFCWLFPLFAVITVGFVKEFGDLYNNFVLGIVYDDARAVALTVWQEHPVFLELGGALCLGWLFARLGRLTASAPWAGAERLAALPRGRAVRAGAILAVLLVFAFAARGGAGRVPLQFRDRDVTTDEFLNRMVLNPISALRYAIRDHLKALEGGDARRYLGPEGPKGALRLLFPGREIGGSLDDALVTKAGGPAPVKPRHVFYVVVESYDSWPLVPPYLGSGLMDGGTKLAAEGRLAPAFISASSGTMTSFSCIVSGLYSPDTRINYQRSSRTPYATAPGVIFRKLGYRTRLFYGGRLSWQRIGEFAKSQGFDEAYGQEFIAEPGSANEWGVDDGSLYAFVEKTVTDDAPSFNLVLTTTNHPPYSLDLDKDGWKGAHLPPRLEALADGHLPDRVMGHLWYADREMARFLREGAAKFPPAVFAVTGDHFSRKFLNSRPGPYEGTSVPLLLYGPEVLGSVKVPERIAGGHLDIAPTLVELCAPAGFPYAAMGRNLLAPDPLPVGFGRGYLVGPDFIANLEGDPTAVPLPFVPPGAFVPPQGLDAVRERFRKLIGLSWWRVMKGNEI